MTSQPVAPAGPVSPVTPVRAQVLVGGETLDRPTAPVTDPACTTEVVGEFALGGAAEVDRAVAAATAAAGGWGRRSAAERAEYLLRAADLLEREIEERAVLLTREIGKVIGESRADAAGAASLLRYFAGLAGDVDARAAGVPAALPIPGQALVRHVPMGPVAVIAPWNTPVYLTFLALGPALMAGNPVVVKPPEDAPLGLSGAVATLASVLPAGVVNLVPGRGPEAGAALAAHPGVRKILFTGSVATGSAVMRSAAASITSVGMELGGNDPALVLADAELTDATVAEFLAGVFTLSGQLCYNVKRIYVHRSRFDEFTERFRAAADRIAVGNGLDPRSTIGPLTTVAGRDRIRGLLASAAAAGATVSELGHAVDPAGWDRGNFVRPAVVTGLPADHELVTTEQFGPVVPILSFETEEEAVALANGTEYGLAASVWSADRARAWELGRRLEAGSVFINVHRVGASPMSVPFGGFKHSGIGRTHGVESVLACSEAQAVVEYDDPGQLPGAVRWAALTNGDTR